MPDASRTVNVNLAGAAEVVHRTGGANAAGEDDDGDDVAAARRKRGGRSEVDVLAHAGTDAFGALSKNTCDPLYGTCSYGCRGVLLTYVPLSRVHAAGNAGPGATSTG